MDISPATKQFVLHWGEMGVKWGVNRTVAQIHALLYVSAKPMHAEEITKVLGVARSNVSQSIRVLQTWNLVQTVPIMGDRREHFITYDDIWTLFKIIITERQQREAIPTCQFLNRLVASPEFMQETEAVRQRILHAQYFANIWVKWVADMIQLQNSVLIKIMHLGSSLQSLLHELH